MWGRNDRQADARTEEALRLLELQVSRMDGILTRFQGIADDVEQHGQELATLKEWREQRDREQVSLPARWSAAAALMGALLVKALDWLHEWFVPARH